MKNDIFGFRSIVGDFRSTDGDSYEGKTATLAGWGTLEEGGKPACILRTVQVPIIDNAKCAASYPEGMVTENMMCAGYDEGLKDSCQVGTGAYTWLQSLMKPTALTSSPPTVFR